MESVPPILSVPESWPLKNIHIISYYPIISLKIAGKTPYAMVVIASYPSYPIMAID
jgi:hypothetical protein